MTDFNEFLNAAFLLVAILYLPFAAIVTLRVVQRIRTMLHRQRVEREASDPRSSGTLPTPNP